MTPTMRALPVAAVGLLLALLPAFGAPSLWPLWIVSVGATFVLLAVDGARTPRLQELALSLDAPARMGIGDPCEATLDLSWSRERRSRLTAALDASSPLEPVARREAELGGAPVKVRFPLVAERRGRGELERLWLRVSGPLGLMARTFVVPVDQQIEIQPSLARVRRLALRFRDRRHFLQGLKIEHYAGEGSEFEALREFLPGHDHRTMDWKASARHRRLLCREFRAERNHQIVIAIDTGRLMSESLTRNGATLPRLDHAVHSALVLAYMALRSGDRVGLCAFDERIRMFAAPRSGHLSFPHLASRCAELAYSQAETNFTVGLTELSSRLRRRSLVVVLTEIVDATMAELMVENLARLSRHHLTLLVALRNPLLEQLATAVPRSLLDLERSVVADMLSRERDVVFERLRRLGIFAVDVLPSEAEPSLLNRYLEIKRRELI